MSSPIEKRKEQLKKYIEAREKEHFVRIVRDWKHFWMNQKQNSEEDYQNYFNRAFGIDANMTYHLADKLVEDDKSAQIARDLLDALEALEFYANNDNWFGPQYYNDERYFLKFRDDDATPVTSPDRLVAGKKARETLAKLSKGDE